MGDVIDSLVKNLVPSYIVAIIQSYLSDRYLIVNEELMKLSSGAAQGSVVGSLFWNLVYDEVVRIRIDPSRIIAYADDLLVILKSYPERILEESSRVTKKIGKKLEEKGLTLEPEKTEALFIEVPNKFKDSRIVVDGVEIETGKSLRHLGFHLSKGLKMNNHVKIVCTKAKKLSNILQSIVPNCFGPSYVKRLMIFQGVLSIIFYGISVWGNFPEMNLKCNLYEITKAIRPMKRALCMAYRTASTNCLDILSGIPPTDLLLEEKYRRSRKEEDFVEINNDIIDRWCIRWRDSPTDVWCKRLIPDLEVWLDREYGYPDFYMTQFFTGHGAFGSYLSRFKIIDSDMCKFCTVTRDTPEHTFFECSRFTADRMRIEAELNINLKPDNIVKEMISSKIKWKIVHNYIKKILTVKSSVYNSRRHDRTIVEANQLPADDIPSGNSGVSRITGT